MHDKLTPIQVLPFLHVQSFSEVKQAADNVLVPHEAVVERADVGILALKETCRGFQTKGVAGRVALECE